MLRFPSSFTNEMRAARKALEAILIISAVDGSVRSTGDPILWYRDATSWYVRSSVAPMTTRSGFRKSLIAIPSLRNSGFMARPRSVDVLPEVLSRSGPTTSLVVFGGTVLLTTTVCLPFFFDKANPRSSVALKRYFRSSEPSSCDGVPTHRKVISVSGTSE
ncbi:hypothetical protein DSECCO2_484550 [anaerobic digester metagenome]